MTQNIENLRVKELRGYMSLKEFAAPLGVTPANVSKIENGEIGLSSDLAKKICDVYDVSMDWLFGRTDERKPAQASKISIVEEPTVDYKTKYIEVLEKLTALQAEKLNKSEIRQTALEK